MNSRYISKILKNYTELHGWLFQYTMRELTSKCKVFTDNEQGFIQKMVLWSGESGEDGETRVKIKL